MNVVKFAIGVFIGVVCAYFAVDILRTRAANEELANAQAKVWALTPEAVIAHCGMPAVDDVPEENAKMRGLIYSNLTIVFSQSGSSWKELYVERTGVQSEQAGVPPADAVKIMPCLAR